ncbi:MAG TPA: hypothetical protein VHG71_00035 [Verrucomicrobiae bacterium]|nr:hypothetical protein [Verrucomicrobiae bacterium]
MSFGHARDYSYGELTIAQKDNEQERFFTPSPAHIAVGVSISNEPPQFLSSLTNLKFTVHLKNSFGEPLVYYILCTSTSWKGGLFEAFDADSCVEFLDPLAFYERLAKAIAEQLPRWACCAKPVHYFSRISLPDTNKQSELVFYKDDIFSIQDEFRFLLVGPQESSDTPRKELALGCLKDICRLREKGSQIAN